MVEMTITVMVGAILLSIAVRAFGETSSRLSVQNARQSFAALQARTRAYAVERGEVTRLRLDPSANTAWIEASGGGNVDSIDFMRSRGVDVQSSEPGIMTLCMNPRGIVEASCNSFSNTVTLTFVQGQESASITLLPLGQLSW